MKSETVKLFPWALLATGLLYSCSGPVARLLDFKASHEPGKSVVVITGCDHGMGRTMATTLASRGYIVVALCLTVEGATTLSAESSIETVVGDVTKKESIDMIVSTLRSIMTRNTTTKLWAVINNAGIAPCGFTDWMPLEITKHCMDVNFFGPVALVKACIPYLMRSRGSRIINISSLAGLSSGANLGSYSASKHAIEGWSKALRAELVPFGIKVCNVNPGFMHTPLLKSSQEAGLALFKAHGNQTIYSQETILRMAKSVDAIQEDPNKVVTLVCKYLITHANPPLRNFCGLQAHLGMRWLLMLPQSVVDTVVPVLSPMTGINHREIARMQAE